MGGADCLLCPEAVNPWGSGAVASAAGVSGDGSQRQWWPPGNFRGTVSEAASSHMYPLIVACGAGGVGGLPGGGAPRKRTEPRAHSTPGSRSRLAGQRHSTVSPCCAADITRSPKGLSLPELRRCPRARAPVGGAACAPRSGPAVNPT